MENIEYYLQRLRFVGGLFRDHQSDLLQENRDKIKGRVEGYKSFKEHTDYDKVLLNLIETFVLS